MLSRVSVRAIASCRRMRKHPWRISQSVSQSRSFRRLLAIRGTRRVANCLMNSKSVQGILPLMLDRVKRPHHHPPRLRVLAVLDFGLMLRAAPRITIAVRRGPLHLGLVQERHFQLGNFPLCGLQMAHGSSPPHLSTCPPGDGARPRTWQLRQSPMRAACAMFSSDVLFH